MMQLLQIQLLTLSSFLGTLVTVVTGDIPPFNVHWNAPTERCQKEYGVPLTDLLRSFGVTVNAGGDGWHGENITIFYSNELGLYPAIKNGTAINGGVPQAVNMTAHLLKAATDINTYIPHANYSGLAIIDWEAWRPLWDRNWDAKDVYRQLSEKIVQHEHPSWSAQQVKKEAQHQFDTVARNMMMTTLTLAKALRPGGKWGYYLFPECYNYDGSRDCKNTTRLLNDKISWLFNASTGLYPSAYLQENANTSHQADFVFGQLEEARRVRAGNMTLPVFLYSRFTYNNNLSHSVFYSLSDVYASVAQAAVLGANGVVLWDDHYIEATPDVCSKVFSFIKDTMGPCVKTSIDFAQTCSDETCNSRGRCALKKDYTDAFSVWKTDIPVKLQLEDLMFRYTQENKSASGDFICECFSGWTGHNCTVPALP